MFVESKSPYGCPLVGNLTKFGHYTVAKREFLEGKLPSFRFALSATDPGPQ